MMTKKNVFIVSMVYSVFFIVVFLVGMQCHSAWCRVHDDDFLGWIFFTFLPLLPSFFFSLLTYRMRDEVFERWIAFAKWYVPVLVVVTLFINSANGGGSGGIGGAVSGWFYGIVIGALYVVFIVVSLAKIISAYRHSNKSK